MLKLLEFLLGDPETQKASGRKVLMYVCSLGLLALFGKIILDGASDTLQAQSMTILGMVVAFYYGKK